MILLLLEIFIPSYGVLTIGALGALAAGLIFAFRLSTATGIIALVAVAILLPIEIIVGVRIFPYTWFGRRIVLMAQDETKRSERSSDESILSLKGAEGITITACRPAGIAEINGERIDVVAEGTVIDNNRPVKVIAVEGNRVVVREKLA